MANVKNFGLIGVGTSVQFGKAGPSLGQQTTTILKADGTAAFRLPAGTGSGGDQPAAATAGSGAMRFNSTLGAMEYSNGSAWTTLATGGAAVTSVIGTAGRVTSSNTGAGSTTIDIDSGYVGQSSITTLGTVTTGTWNGTTIAVANGGTGATTLTQNGVLFGNGTGAVGATAEGATGQVLLGNSGNAPSWGALTSAAVTSFNTGTTGLLANGNANTAETGAVLLSGVLDADNGGTGLSTFNSGDVLYASANNVWSAGAKGSTSGVQAWDAALDALAAKTSTGILVQDGADSYISRTLVAPAEGFTITGADGVSGNPTFALSDDLAGLEGLAGTGYAIRTGSGTWITRSITGTTGTVVVTVGDGVSSNTDLNLATVTNNNTGTFVKIDRDTYGRVAGTTAVATGDITALVDGTYVNITGDTMTGSLIMTGGSTQVVLPNAPVGDTDAANKAYVDSIAAGLSWKQAVDAATTANLTATYNNGSSGVGATLTNSGTQAALVIDGVTLSLTQRVLVKDQVNGSIIAFDNLVGGTGYTDASYPAHALTGGTGSGATADITVAGGVVTNVTLVNPGSGYTDNDSLSAAGLGAGTGFTVDVNGVGTDADNGIYTVTNVGSGSTNWVLTRSTEMNQVGEFHGATVFVTGGTVNDNSGWTQTEIIVTVGTDPVLWQQFSGSQTYTWGVGLANTGNTVNVNLGAGIKELPNDEVGLDIATGTAVQLTGTGLASGDQLTFVLAGGSGLSQSASGLTIAPGGVTNAMLANNFINFNTDAGNDNVALGESLLIAGTPTQGIGTSSSANTVTITAADASSSQKGVATFDATEFAVTTGNVVLGLVGATKGGTGQSAYTVGDILYANTTTSLAKLAVGTSTQVLKGGTTPGWGSVNLTTDITGVLPVPNGGTGINTLGANQVMIGNGTSAVLTGTGLTFVGETLTVGTTAPLTINGATATIASTTTNGNINIVPNGTGSVVIGPSGAGLIQSDAGQPLTVRGNTTLTLTSVTGDTTMVLAAGTTDKVTISGPTAPQYATGLADEDLVNKYYVDQAAGQTTGDVKAVQATVSLTSATSVNIGAALPAGVTILSVKVNVTTASDAVTTLVVGKSGGSEYMTAAENDPEVTGLYLAETDVDEGSSVQVQATVATPGTVGSAKVIVTSQIN